MIVEITAGNSVVRTAIHLVKPAQGLVLGLDYIVWVLTIGLPGVISFVVHLLINSLHSYPKQSSNLISPRTKLIGVLTIRLPAVITLKIHP